MSRLPTQYTQAQLARALRAMKQVFGTASVVFETDGTVRVTAEQKDAPVDVANSWDDIMDLVPSSPEPTRKLTEDDLKQLRATFPHRTKEWIQAIPNLDFHWRERMVLEQLERYGIGARIRLNSLRQCGTETAEKLYIRGYVDLGYSKKEPTKIDTLALTADGLQAIAPPPKRINSAGRPRPIRL